MLNLNEKIRPVWLQFIRNSKETVKKHKSSENKVIKFGISCLYTFRNITRFVIRFFTDSDFRSILFNKLFKSKSVHQTTSTTFLNRYPEVFLGCRHYFADREDIKILSFGCSTGEEVLTLRKYFPKAHIVGAEINKHSLEICRKLSVDNKISFVYSTTNEIQKSGPFDAIFCMAVLQREPHVIASKGITSLKNTYPFEKFQQQILELDELLNPKGVLILQYTQYSLMDTTVGYKYKPLGNYNQDDYVSPIFDINSNIVKNPTSQKTIFIKS